MADCPEPDCKRDAHTDHLHSRPGPDGASIMWTTTQEDDSADS